MSQKTYHNGKKKWEHVFDQTQHNYSISDTSQNIVRLTQCTKTPGMRVLYSNCTADLTEVLLTALIWVVVVMKLVVEVRVIHLLERHQLLLSLLVPAHVDQQGDARRPHL